MKIDRREFVQVTAGAVAMASAGVYGNKRTSSGLLTSPPLDRVRIGFVGVGHQGTSHVRNFVSIPGVDVTAICDIVPEKVERAAEIVTASGSPRPLSFTSGPEAYRDLCERDDVDLVFTATPWDLHVPVCLAAMRSGKHAATEVPMSTTLDGCWELVETSEDTRRHCVMMENCCYDRTEMMLLRMVRSGLFGELLHAECGYLHDLRELKLTDFYEGNWRVRHSIERNGDLYPTHGLGPVAQMMNINRGNRFQSLVSFSTRSRGLNLWAARHTGAASDAALRSYALGDIVNTVITTAEGQTILITHDTNSPRPYSRRIVVQGTRGLARKYPDPRIHIEGRSPQHTWEDLGDYADEFDHPVWRALEDRSRGAGHGGMDYIEDFRLVECLRKGLPMDMDVYDGAAWSAVSELSERSINSGSMPQEFPDFTRGNWPNREPLGVVETDIGGLE